MRRTILLFNVLLLTTCLSAQYGNTSWKAAGIDFDGIALPKTIALLSDKSNTSDADYTQGVFIVNEDWYGHQNSSVNFLTNKGEWIYNVFQKENPGRELGCTTQYGTIYGDKFYFVSKQQQDPGAKTRGSRFAVCDARTMKIIKEFEFIATKTVTGTDGKDSLVSIADGRSYLPVDEHKGYIGTSNGIWIYNSDKMEIGKQIEGSGNPNSAGYGQLYYAQIGMMVRANNYVFAVHQQYGLLVIDTKTDKIVRTIKAPIEKETVNGKEKEIQRGFGSIVQSKDGNLWISMAYSTSGTGGALDYMLKLNPFSFEVDTIRIPTKKGIDVIPNSWYAWTADGFCASKQENKIYWNGQDERGSWFIGYNIFCYDIDKNTFSKVFDMQTYPGDWRLYGTAFRIHPVTDEIYAFFYHEFQDPTHLLARISNQGKMINEYSMISNYWFPAIPVFPDNYPPVLSEDFPESIELSKKVPEYKLYLGDKISDEDNMESAIVKSISKVADGNFFNAVIRNDSLVVILKDDAKAKTGTVTVQFNSNGKCIFSDILVKTNPNGNGNENIESQAKIYYNKQTDCLQITGLSSPIKIAIFDMQGRLWLSLQNCTTNSINIKDLPKGIYIAKMNNGKRIVSIKFVK